MSSPLPGSPCSSPGSPLGAGTQQAHMHITNPLQGAPGPATPHPPRSPALHPHPLCRTPPGHSQGNTGPAWGVHPAGRHARWHRHRAGSRAPMGMRTPGGFLAGRGHSRWQQGCPCHRLPVLSQLGCQRHIAPSRATSAPLAHHRGLRMSWHLQFQLPRCLPFTLTVPLQSQQAKCQEGRTSVGDASAAPLTPLPTPTTRSWLVRIPRGA